MGFLDGARFIGFIVKAIKTICTWAYKLGVLALLIIVFLVAYLDLKPAWLWYTLGFAWFIVHWVDFFFPNRRSSVNCSSWYKFSSQK